MQKRRTGTPQNPVDEVPVEQVWPETPLMSFIQLLQPEMQQGVGISTSSIHTADPAETAWL